VGLGQNFFNFFRAQDGSGNPLSSYYQSSTGDYALNTHAVDVHNAIVNSYLHFHTATETTLAVATVGDGTEYQITVASAVGFAIGDDIHIGDGVTERTHPRIINILGAVLTLDRRLDKAHAIGTPVEKVYLDMSINAGTLAAPIVYWTGPAAGEVWHLTRIILALVHGTAGDLGLFGNLTALTNGVVVRVRSNNAYILYTNWKTAADIKMDMYDVEFDTRSGGGGSYGTSGRGTFTRSGAVLRLDGAQGDRLEVMIQDDVTALDFFGVKAQGHLEDA
jgi:hypothetical protein